MDNASKAVVMAGGILVAMGIIALLMYMYVNAQTYARANEEAMTVSQIESFNRFYTAYMETRTGASTVKCIDGVNILNRALEDDVTIAESSSFIDFADGYYKADSASYVAQNVQYEVGFDASGRVSSVTIR